MAPIMESSLGPDQGNGKHQKVTWVSGTPGGKNNKVIGETDQIVDPVTGQVLGGQRKIGETGPNKNNEGTKQAKKPIALPQLSANDAKSVHDSNDSKGQDQFHKYLPTQAPANDTGITNQTGHGNATLPAGYYYKQDGTLVHEVVNTASGTASGHKLAQTSPPTLGPGAIAGIAVGSFFGLVVLYICVKAISGEPDAREV